MGFKRYNPDGYPSEYEPLHDPHLRKYIQRTQLKEKLRRNGLITCDTCVKCTLKDFNSYRLYLNSIYLFYEKYGVSHNESCLFCRTAPACARISQHCQLMLLVMHNTWSLL